MFLYNKQGFFLGFFFFGVKPPKMITHESQKTYFQWSPSGGELGMGSTLGDNPLLFSEECTAFFNLHMGHIAHRTV